MTGRKEELAQRLQRDFDACDRHVLRIREALAGLSADVPLSAEVYEAFTPEIFTLTGGVMKSSDLFFDDLKKRLPGMRLEICGTGQNAGLLGSAVYGFQKVKENQK